jgi:hypothetical protein
MAVDIGWYGSLSRRRAEKQQPSAIGESLWGEATPVQDTGSCLQDAARRLQELVRLPPGWDSYGGLPVQVKAVEGALRVLGTLPLNALPPLHISPVADGGLQLEWSFDDGRAAEIEVRPTGSIEFLLDLGKEGTVEGSRPWPDDARSIVERLLDR